MHAAIKFDEKIDRVHAAFACRQGSALCDQRIKSLTARGLHEVGRQFGGQPGLVGKGKAFAQWLKEEVEGVDRHEVCHQVDRQRQFSGFLGKHQTGDMVALRVLLPVEEVLLRLDGKGVAGDPRAGVACRLEPYHMRPERDVAVKAVRGAVMQCHTDRHLSVLRAQGP